MDVIKKADFNLAMLKKRIEVNVLLPDGQPRFPLRLLDCHEIPCRFF